MLSFSTIESIRKDLEDALSGVSIPKVDHQVHPTHYNTVPPSTIDHTLLSATATYEHIESLCADAIKYGFASVCVNGRWVSTVSTRLKETSVKTCTVIGFPLGAVSSTVKVIETKQAVLSGAEELDMVVSIGDVKATDWQAVYQDIKGVVDAAGKASVKVILETCYLTPEEIVATCLIAKLAGARFVKTSTGFGTCGAQVDHVQLMRLVVGNEIGVKASGGIRTHASALEFLSAGATRLGTSRGPSLIE